MRIGLDAKRAFFNSTGLGNYGRTLIAGLLQYHPEADYLLYSPKAPQNRFPDFEQKTAPHTTVHYPEKGLGSFFPSLWRSFGLSKTLKKDKIDLYHGLSMEIPTSLRTAGIRSAVCIHDLIFIKHPEFYPIIDRAIYRKKYLHACHNADMIVALSEQTRADILNDFHLSEDRVRVIHMSSDPLFSQRVGEETKATVKQRYGLPDRFILSVGTINTRKNLLGLVKAFEKLPASLGVSLVAIGKGGAYKKEVEQFIHAHDLSDRVHFPKNVANSDLPAIYQQAALFAYPSFYEGFGLPILEALQSRVPVVTTKGGCFPEAGGPNSLYIDPANIDELTDALQTGLTNSELRNRMIEAGLTHAAKFTPHAFADKTWALYQDL
ncbi:MAG: hypothetical protein A2293_14110 [Elusimicrobia bacterium RIFOXYB2_FULL_49_7]|nr:MAG: hypothetical protein A2293_14110 [Elusimicrobia bacterium RIFOXYB2_FULL_49_7]